MRIIKEGKKPATEWQITCERCGCVFAFNGADISYIQREDSEWVNCPSCHVAIDVKDRNKWEEE